MGDGVRSDGLARPFQDGIPGCVANEDWPRRRVIIMPGDLVDAGHNDLNSRGRLRSKILQIFVDADDGEAPQGKGEIEALARARIVQVFPIAERAARSAQMA